MRVDNVALVCPRCTKPTRMGYRIADAATRCATAARRCGQDIGSDLIAMAETTITRRACAAATRARCARRSRSVRVPNAMQMPRLEKITLNMGVGEAKHELEGARRGRRAARRSIAGQRPLITQGEEVDRRLQAPRGHAHRLQGDAARRPHVGVPRPADLDRPAAHPRLPRARPELVRRPRQLLAGPARADHLSRDRLRHGSIGCAGWT